MCNRALDFEPITTKRKDPDFVLEENKMPPKKKRKLLINRNPIDEKLTLKEDPNLSKKIKSMSMYEIIKTCHFNDIMKKKKRTSISAKSNFFLLKMSQNILTHIPIVDDKFCLMIYSQHFPKHLRLLNLFIILDCNL